MKGTEEEKEGGDRVEREREGGSERGRKGDEGEEGRKGGRQCEYSICICALN